MEVSVEIICITEIFGAWGCVRWEGYVPEGVSAGEALVHTMPPIKTFIIPPVVNIAYVGIIRWVVESVVI